MLLMEVLINIKKDSSLVAFHRRKALTMKRHLHSCGQTHFDQNHYISCYQDEMEAAPDGREDNFPEWC
jgi:hypothetical protein